MVTIIDSSCDNFAFNSRRTGSSLVQEVRQISSDNDIGDVESFSSSLGSQWNNPLPLNFAGQVSRRVSTVFAANYKFL